MNKFGIAYDSRRKSSAVKVTAADGTVTIVSRNERRVPTKLRDQVLLRDKGYCRYCARKPKDLHIDHVQPVTKGGLTVLENLVVACAYCNMKKKTATDWKPYPLRFQKERIKKRERLDREREAAKRGQIKKPKSKKPAKVDVPIMSRLDRLKTERQVNGIWQDDWNAFNRAIAKDD